MRRKGTEVAAVCGGERERGVIGFRERLGLGNEEKREKD